MEHKEVKKPIPTPRRFVPCRTTTTVADSTNLENKPQIESIVEEHLQPEKDEEKMPFKEEFNNTISRRLSKTSKQIAGEIGQIVSDRKNAVIEGTRQSVRRIRRRFSNISQERQNSESEKSINDLGENEVPCDMFNNIKFDSPLNKSTSIYSNVELENDSDDSTGSLHLPPPTHPPPPLPDESYYDAPSSITSNSTSEDSHMMSSSLREKSSKQDTYESVFPIRRPKSESESSIDETDASTGIRSRALDLSRSESWAFHDLLSQDHIYGNVVNKKISSSYENVIANHKQVIEDSLIDKVVNQLMENARLKVEGESQNAVAEGTTNTEKTDRDNSSQSVSSSSSSSKAGSYENHAIIVRSTSEKEKPRASKSVLMQFDPLSEADDSESLTKGQDIKLLEELLQGDLYGTISEAHTLDDWSISNESDSEEFFNPPTPPLRVDSLPGEDQPVEIAENSINDDNSNRNALDSPPEIPKKASKKTSKNPERPVRRKKATSKCQNLQENSSRTSWFLDDNTNNNVSQKTEVKKNWLQQVKEVVEKTPFKSTQTKACFIDRPVLGGTNFVHKKGMLYKVQGGPVEDLFGEYSGRWCVLEKSSFVCYSDNTCMHTKEHFPAQNILSVQILQDAKYKYRYDNDDLHCFELNTTGKARGGHIFGSRNVSERRIWMQMIAEMLTQRFKSRLTSNFMRMGWAYLREGVSGKWSGAWLLLSERELHYAVDRHSVKTIDLRKARCLVLHALHPEEIYPKTNDKGPNMLVDCPEVTLYLRMWTGRETKVWCHVVKREAHNNGANIDQQQLTKNDIPVIVEKCINFIYAHGSMSEGIYRKAGQSSSISDLLLKFRKDAFAVQVTKNTYNEYEVATALKRFFRDLPEPLLGCDHRQYLCEVAKHNDHDEKIRMFKAALDQLPIVAYKTTRKLLGHLHFISNQCEKNRMTVENLAAIWGPTLMHYEDKDKPKNLNNANQQEVEVVCQLIKFYRNIFPEDPGELEKEKIMLKVLEKHAQSPQGVAANRKTTGDFRVWIYVFNKDGKAFNISIGASKTAYEVCLEICDKVNTQVHEIVLEEVVLADRLVRPIHHEEKVLNIVLKWGYWDESDRKDNYLLVSNLSKYWEYIIEKPLPMSGELRFADSKSKLFKTTTFQFSQGILMNFKDKTGEVVLNSWPIEELIWYLGHESKRNPQSRWTVTFLELKTAPVRTKTSPYFGNVLVWNDAASRANWLSAMLKARYPNNFTPPPKLVTI